MGLIEGQHYVINEQPKEEWGIDAFSKLRNTKILSLAYGAFIVLDSLENYNKHRGASYDKIHVDEFREVNPDVRKVLLGWRWLDWLKRIDWGWKWIRRLGLNFPK